MTARRIPGSKNVTADSMSRKFNGSIEWSWNGQGSFEMIVNKWGRPTVDLFTSRLNHQVDSYVYFQPDPQAWQLMLFQLVGVTFNFTTLFHHSM